MAPGTAVFVPRQLGVLDNDSDPDGDTLEAVLETEPVNGQLTLNPNGSFTYTPDVGFVGADTITYRASDGILETEPATVTVHVTGPPFAFELSDPTAPQEIDDSAIFSVGFSLKSLGENPIDEIELEVFASKDGALSSGDRLLASSILSLGEPILPDTLGARASVEVGYSILAPGIGETESFTLEIVSDQLASDGLDSSVEARPIPVQLVYDEGVLSRELIADEQTFIEFEIFNAGQETAEGLGIALPPLSWMTLANAAQIGDLAGGESAVVTFVLTPPENLPLGEYAGEIFLDYETPGGQDVLEIAPFDWDAGTGSTGGFRLSMIDEYTFFAEGSPLVQDATVRVIDPATGQLIERFDDVDGTL